MRAPWRVLALVVLLLLTVPGRAHADYDPNCAVEPVCAETYWAGIFGNNPPFVIGVGNCESTQNPYAVNKEYTVNGWEHPTGLYQFLPSTWAELVAKHNALADPNGIDYPEYRGIWSIGAQAHMFNWAIANGYSYKWQCITG